VILLPDSVDGLPALEERLTVESLEGWLGALSPMRLHVYLPRFRITSSYGLKAVLAAMGMPNAFDPATADLSGIAAPASTGGERLFLGAAVHKAFIAVDEEGTEAAAATGVTVGVTSLPPTFSADHPFLYLIRDTATGALLFLGRVERPA
jgi:serpin B